MKKILICLVVAIMFVMVSCGDENTETVNKGFTPTIGEDKSETAITPTEEAETAI